MLCCELCLVKRNPKSPEATLLRCRSWTCEQCVDYRRRQLKRLARAGKPTSFITLTSRATDDETADERAQKMVRAWRLIVKRAKRQFHLKRLPYLTVIEATKKGEPHLHILARVKWLPQKWLSAQCDELLNAPVVWIERINAAAKIAAYVAKYIGKAPHKFSGVKRYWRSLDYIHDRKTWDEAIEANRGVWSKANYSIATAAWLFRQAGFTVETSSDGKIRGSPNGGPIDEQAWLTLFAYR